VTCCTGSDVDDVRGVSAGRVSGARSEKGFDIGDTVEVAVFAPNRVGTAITLFGVSATVGDRSVTIICSINDMLTGRVIYSPDTALTLSPFGSSALTSRGMTRRDCKVRCVRTSSLMVAGGHNNPSLPSKMTNNAVDSNIPTLRPDPGTGL
jgi:hypothetical protein